MRPLFTLLWSPLLFLCSCTSGTEHQAKATTQDSTIAATPVADYDTTLSKGQIVDTVTLKDDNSQSYALYLPSGYSPARSYQCIYFFDAHARGVFPLARYKDIADQYGIVLVSSNISRNGLQWEATNSIAQKMMADSRARINIDAKRIYTCGFSGGARVAGALAAQGDDISGVIGCSAGFLQNGQAPGRKFSYFGFVGTADFNFNEMENQDGLLQQNGFTHQLISFDGKHGWPSATDFKTAVLWLLTNEIKLGSQPQNDVLIQALKTDYAKRIKSAGVNNDWITVAQLYDGAIGTLDSLTDIKDYKQQKAMLINSDRYKKATTKKNQLQQQEITEQQQLANEFATHDKKWWAGTIAAMQQKSKTHDNMQEAGMSRRLLAYLGLVAYMNTTHALGNGDIANAENYVEIFTIADPKNPDCDYLKAVCAMKKNDPAQALKALYAATVKGYNDMLQLKTEPTFSPLQNNDGFIKVLEKAQHNEKIGIQ